MSAYTEVDFITDDTEPSDRSPLRPYEGEKTKDFFHRRHRDGTLILHLTRGLALVYGDELRWLPTEPAHGDVVGTRRDFRYERNYQTSAYVWIADDGQPGRWERVPGYVAGQWLEHVQSATRPEPGQERPVPPLSEDGIRCVFRMASTAVRWAAGHAEAEGVLGDRARDLAKELDGEVLGLSPGTAITGSPY